MWAEAIYDYKAGRGFLDLPNKMKIEAELQRAEYQEEDTRVGLIQEWLDTTREERVCVLMLWEKALEEFGKPSRRMSNEIHEIMRRQIKGWIVHPNENGKARCGKYGNQVCYVRDGLDKLAPPSKETVALL